MRSMAKKMYVSPSTVSRWENGSRLPDAAMIVRISEILGVDVNSLLTSSAQSEERPNVILVDDIKPILLGSLPVLEEVLPNAVIKGYLWPAEALEYARENRVSLAFLDINLGGTNGLDLCRALLEINPHTNVVYLTAYSDYALDAWNTDAVGFLLKPITPDGIREQLKKLRYPFPTGYEHD